MGAFNGNLDGVWCWAFLGAVGAFLVIGVVLMVRDK